MIESTALSLSLAFLALHGRFVARGRASDAVAALAAGCLGAAVKPPTIVPCAALAAVGWLLARRQGTTATARGVGAMLVVLPPLAGWAWQQHADTVKALNSFTSVISSGQLLRDYVFGSAASRLGPDAVASLWQRALPYTVGHPVVAGGGASEAGSSPVVAPLT